MWHRHSCLCGSRETLSYRFRILPEMRTTAILLLLLATTLSAQTTPEHGVFVQDIDTKADACTNFFDYANGAWRAANPITIHV